MPCPPRRPTADPPVARAGWACPTRAARPPRHLFDEIGASPALDFFTGALGWSFLVERGVTILGHASSRALVYAALRHRSPSFALLALALFTLNDGAAGYPELRGWEWTPGLLAAMNAFFAALVAVEFTCVYLLERTPTPPPNRRQPLSDQAPSDPPTPPDGRSTPRACLT